MKSHDWLSFPGWSILFLSIPTSTDILLECILSTFLNAEQKSFLALDFKQIIFNVHFLVLFITNSIFTYGEVTITDWTYDLVFLFELLIICQYFLIKTVYFNSCEQVSKSFWLTVPIIFNSLSFILWSLTLNITFELSAIGVVPETPHWFCGNMSCYINGNTCLF